MRKDGLEKKQKKQLRKLKANERIFSFMRKNNNYFLVIKGFSMVIGLIS